MSFNNRLRRGFLAVLLCVSVGRTGATETTNPLADKPDAITAGAALFTQMNCDGCHGIGAPGWVGPSLVDGRWRFGGDDSALFQSISEGRPHGMPAYGALLAESGIWEIISYLRSLPKPRDVPTLHWPRER
jgi:cytochrome c oxidase cbb3-type subunit 3